MKKEKLIASIAAGTLTLSLMLTGCGEAAPSGGDGKENTAQTQTQNDEAVVEFVAADKTNWDKAVNVGSYAYNIHVTLNADGTLTLTGTCVGKAQASVQQGPPRGGGGTDPSATPAEDVPEPDEATMRSLDFTQNGTWTKQDGYGYTLTLGDAVSTKTDFDKASSRHIFYLPIYANDANSGLVQFQGKDTAFRKELTADYEDFEVRDAEYIFEYTNTSTGNNPNSTHLYLEKDGTANSLNYSGSSSTYKRGTWEKGADGNLTISLWGKEITGIYCSVQGKEGYRVNLDGTLLYSNTDAEYVDADFDGATVMTLLCGEGDYTLALTEKGIAVLYNNGSRTKDGVYTGSGDSLSVTLDGVTYKAEGGKLNISWTSGEGSSASTVDRTFNTDGTQPEAPAPAGNTGNGESASGGEAPTEGGEAPADGGEAPTEGGEAPAEGGEAPAEGGESSSGGEAPAEGGEAPAEGGEEARS